MDHTGLLRFARDLFGSACWGRAVASGGTPRGLGFSVTCYAARLLRGELSLLGKGYGMQWPCEGTSPRTQQQP